MGMTLPKPQAVKTDPLVNETAPDLLIDGTERRVNVQAAQQQREHYSGKKRATPIRNSVG